MISKALRHQFATSSWSVNMERSILPRQCGLQVQRVVRGKSISCRLKRFSLNTLLLVRSSALGFKNMKGRACPLWKALEYSAEPFDDIRFVSYINFRCPVMLHVGRRIAQCSSQVISWGTPRVDWSQKGLAPWSASISYLAQESSLAVNSALRWKNTVNTVIPYNWHSGPNFWLLKEVKWKEVPPWTPGWRYLHITSK